MPNVRIIYSRLTSVTVAGGAGTQRLTSPGTAGTDYCGTYSFAGGSLAVGDVIRIHAWGRVTNTSANAANYTVLLYFNAATPANLANPVAQSHSLVIAGRQSEYFEWHLMAQLTVRATGANGSMWCDALIENVEPPPGGCQFSNMMGQGASIALNTTAANSIELAVSVGQGASFVLDQTSIEYLPSPCTGASSSG